MTNALTWDPPMVLPCMQENKVTPDDVIAKGSEAATESTVTAMSVRQSGPVMAPYKPAAPASLLPPPPPPLLLHTLRDSEAVIIPGRPDMPKLFEDMARIAVMKQPKVRGGTRKPCCCTQHRACATEGKLPEGMCGEHPRQA